METKIVKVPPVVASLEPRMVGTSTSTNTTAGTGTSTGLPYNNVDTKPRSSLKTLKLKEVKSVQISEEYWTDEPADSGTLASTADTADVIRSSVYGNDTSNGARIGPFTTIEPSHSLISSSGVDYDLGDRDGDRDRDSFNKNKGTNGSSSCLPSLALACDDKHPPHKDDVRSSYSDVSALHLDSSQSNSPHDSVSPPDHGQTIALISTTGMDQTTVALSDVDHQVEVEVEVEVVNAPVGIMNLSESNGSDEAVQANTDPLSSDVTTECEVVKVWARVSYLGWPERCDVWSELISTSIARLDSRSHGRRGDCPIREEVVFLVADAARLMNSALAPPDEYTHSQDTDQSTNIFTVSKYLCNARFLSPYLADIVNIFGENRGFESLLNYLALARAGTESQVEVGYEANAQASVLIRSLSAPMTMSIITALGGLHLILSPQFLVYLGHKDVLGNSAFLLRNMGLKDLRETQVEAVEAALSSLEGLASSMSSPEVMNLTHLGSSSPPSVTYELEAIKLYFDVAVRYLDCPYLNRRLAGLKMLIDLFKRAQASAAHPSGLNVVRTTFGGQESVSYRVVPQLPFYSVRSLCEDVASSGLMCSIFRGERAHESLMLRSGEILRTMSQEGCLHNSVLIAMWDAGLIQREAAAMGTLTEIISTMLTPSLSFLLLSLLEVEPGSATVHIVDVLSAVAVRCRALLMREKEQHMTSNLTSRQVVAQGEDGPMDDVVLDLHNQVLLRLWHLSEDSSGATDQVAAKCLLKLLAVIGLGATTAVEEANADQHYTWDRQWLRCKVLVQCALDALKDNRSVAPAVRLLHAFICSWPLRTDVKQSPPRPVDHLYPFSNFSRGAVAEYLESTYGVFDIITSSVTRSKELFTISAAGIAGDRAVIASTVSAEDSSPIMKHNAPLSEELQSVLNDLMIGKSRVGYKELLTRSFDFLHQFLRCSDSLMLNQEVIRTLWRGVALQAVTSEEANVVLSFLSRLILRSPLISSTAIPQDPFHGPAPLSCLPCTTQEDALERTHQPTVKRKAVCSLDVIKWTFQDLLCDKLFIISPFFTPQAFACVEKYFRWLNTEAGNITETKLQTFTIIGAPSSLIGIGVFLDIIISCQLDHVAVLAAAFLTSLPTCLAPSLVQQGELSSLRQLLLKQCNDHLARAVHHTVEPRALSRLLMLLSGLLEESYLDVKGQVKPHGSLSRGAEIAVHVSGVNKMKGRSGPLLMYSNDTLRDLLQEISLRMDKSISKLKIFRLAKDISLLDGTKTLGQMKFGVSGSEQIMVSERAAVIPAVLSLLKPCEVISEDSKLDAAYPSIVATPISQSNPSSLPLPSSDCQSTSVMDVDITSMVSSPTSPTTALSATSSSEQLDMLFFLLESSERALVDEIWGLITRLPSSPSLTAAWQSLTESPSSATDLLFALSAPVRAKDCSPDSDISVVTSPSRLLYNLQIIEALLQPHRANHSVDLKQDPNEATEAMTPQTMKNTELGTAYDWSSQFLAKGGFDAVCAVYDWLSHYMQKPSPTAQPVKILGSSPCLGLLIFEIVVRLMRSLLMRATAAVNDEGTVGRRDGMLALLRNLQATRDIFSPVAPAAASVAPVTPSRGAFIGPLAAPMSPNASVSDAEHSLVNRNPVSDEGVSMKSFDESKESQHLLAHEWCWAVTCYSSSQLKECLLSANLDSIQHTSLTLITCLRSFCSEDIFQEDVSDWTMKTATRARRRVLFAVLDSLFAVWTIAAFTKPDILLSLTSSSSIDYESGESVGRCDYKNALQSFLVQALLGVGKCSVVRSDMGDLAAKWISEELQAFFAFSRLQHESPSECSSLDGMFSPCGSLMTGVFNTFLEFRPLLVVSSSSAVRCPASSASEFSLNEFYAVALALLAVPAIGTPSLSSSFSSSSSSSSPPDPSENIVATLSLSNEKRFQICMGIFQELKAASSHMTDTALHEAAEGSYESTVTLTTDLRVNFQSVAGTLRILNGLITNSNRPLSSTGEINLNSTDNDDVLHVLYGQSDILSFLLVECLGLISVTSRPAPVCLCNDDHSRAAAYSILTTLCQWRPSVSHDVFRHLKPVFESVPALTMWDFKPEKDVRSVTGFVGLRNKGCTCYMNSLLQVLYMMPEVRQGILSIEVPPSRSADHASNDIILQLQRLFFNLKYGEKKAFSPDDWVFAYKDESGLLPVNVSQQQDAQEFLQVLCERLSARNSLVELTTAGSLPLPQERPNGLSEMKEAVSTSSSTSSSTSTASSSSSPIGDLLRSSFGGKLCNQMLREDVELNGESYSSSAGTCGQGNGQGNGNGQEKGNASCGIREQEDPFFCLSMQVKDARGLEHSLAQFVEGEKISDYQWDDTGPRVTISKRQCISQLSDTLIFHLKRFELNFDTFRREKVNDSFSFPMHLNMLPYTKEGLMSSTATETVDSSGVATGRVVSGGDGTRPSAYYQYELAGVVVHSGTTDSGHYYAYIKDRKEKSAAPVGASDTTRAPSSSTSTSTAAPSSSSASTSTSTSTSSADTGSLKKGYRWLEFNDSEVTEFPESRLEAECFGGSIKSYDYSVSTISEVETVNPKSAYMLVYRRARTLGSPNTSPSPTLPVSTVSTGSTATLSEPVDAVKNAAETPTKTKECNVVDVIRRENARHTMLLRLAEPLHLSSISTLLRLVVKSTVRVDTTTSPLLIDTNSADLGPGSGALPVDILEGLLVMTTDFIAHSSFTKTAKEILDALSASVKASIAMHRTVEHDHGNKADAMDSSSLDCTGLRNGQSHHNVDNQMYQDKYDSMGMGMGVDMKVDSQEGQRMCSTSTLEPDSDRERREGDNGRDRDRDKEKEKEKEGDCDGECPSMPSKKARLVNVSAFIDESESCIEEKVISDPLQQSLEGLQELAAVLAKKIASKDNFDRVISLLYCPDLDTRLAFAHFLLSCFQLFCVTDGVDAFAFEGDEVCEDLLNKDFALVASLTSDMQDSRPKNLNSLQPVLDVSDIFCAVGSEDEEIALAIKMSMECHPNTIHDIDADICENGSVIPPVVAIPIPLACDSGKGDNGSIMEADGVVEMSYPVTDNDGSGPPVATTAVSYPPSYASHSNSPSNIKNDASLFKTSSEEEMNVASDDNDNDNAEDGNRNSEEVKVLTQESASAPPQQVQNIKLSHAARFLLELTRDSRIQLIAENWRRSEAVIALMLAVCHQEHKSSNSTSTGTFNSSEVPSCLSGGQHRLFLMRRQLVSQLISVFTGDVSPIQGMAAHGSRKTAPSSYIMLGPPNTRGGPHPVASKNIPDWGQLLDCVAALVTSCRTETMQVQVQGWMDSSQSQSQPMHPMCISLGVDAPLLDCASCLSVTSRTLYSTALKQSRYSGQLTSLILHLSYESLPFSDMVCELLLEALFQCSAETTAHVFSIMEAFLSVEDSLTGHRALSMFSGEASPLSRLKGIQDQGPKRRLVCVCIYSLMTLLQRVPSVREALTNPPSTIRTWAPWMLKFSFLFMNDCLKENSNATALKNSYMTAHSSPDVAFVPSPPEKGDYYTGVPHFYKT